MDEIEKMLAARKTTKDAKKVTARLRPLRGVT